MVKITHLEHLEQVAELEIVPYIRKLLECLLEEYKEYCPNASIESIGAIYLISSKSDMDNHLDFGLSMPIDKSRFEWIEYIGNNFINSCIVLDNDRAINIIGRREYFEHLMEG